MERNAADENGSMDSARRRAAAANGDNGDLEFSGSRDQSSNVDASSANGAGAIIKGSLKHDMSAGILIPTPENINVSSKSDEKIVFRRYPCTLWVAGVFIILCGVYLIYHLASPESHGRLFEGYEEG